MSLKTTASHQQRAEDGWTAAPAVSALPGPDEVHVWRARISRFATRDRQPILSADEQERADRFRREEDRHRFAVTRTQLRIILGQYLDQAPSSLSFRYSDTGKPSLENPITAIPISFNVSHSGDFSLLAFSSGLDVGIDLEFLRIARDVVELARVIYPPEQYRQFLAIPEAQRHGEFFRSWTRREAIGKALGVGISITQDAYDGALAESSEWSLCGIDVADDYVASLAARTRRLRVDLRDCASWSPGAPCIR
jgi:4'-phosphopantetheinyl transferase